MIECSFIEKMSVKLMFRALASIIMILAGMIASGLASDWSQWLGTDRNGITPESSDWPAGWPPKKLWTKNVGKGCTSPIMVGGKIYVMGWQGEGDLNNNPVGIDTIYCLDAKTGGELWKQTYPCRYQGRLRTGDEGAYGGPSSTPTFDSKTSYLYTLSIDGDLYCWNTSKNGQLVWSKNLYDEYNVPQRPDVGGGKRDYGFTSSPLIQNDLLTVEVGDDEGNIMAFDKRTGQRKWTSACTEFAGHSSGPVPLTVDGVRCLATLTLRKLVVMRTDKGHEGKTIAEYPWQTDYANNIATPAVVDNKIVVTSSQNISKTALFEVSLEGATEKWRVKDFSQVCSPIVYKGYIYMASGPLKCLDITNGQRKWQGGEFDHGSCLVTARDSKVIAFGNGQLVLAEAFPSDGQYHELSSVKEIVPDICYPHVALSNGIICCKDKSGNMVCFSI